MAARLALQLLLSAVAAVLWPAALSPQILPPGLAGRWEACLPPGTDGDEHVRHVVLELTAAGRFGRTTLADDPARPMREESGAAGIEGDMLVLSVEPLVLGAVAPPPERIAYALSAAGPTLRLGREPGIPYEPAGEIPRDLFGTWGVLIPGGDDVVGRLRFEADGTFESDLGGGLEVGRFATAGTGLVHWIPEADPTSPVAPAGVWSRVRVEGDRLAYDIACSFTVEARRLAGPTAVARRTWGQVKAAAFPRP